MRKLMHVIKLHVFWKEHKDDIECMYCGRSRYMKVINEDGAFFTIKVVIKRLLYILITPSTM
jgi:hypothetical protein